MAGSRLKSPERILQNRNDPLIFGTIRGQFAGEDTLERQHPELQFADFDFHGAFPFIGKLPETVHANDYVKRFTAGATEHGRVEAERGNVCRTDVVESSRQFGIAQVIEPQVNILGDDGRALQRRGGEAHHQEADFVAKQRLQEPQFSV